MKALSQSGSSRRVVSLTSVIRQQSMPALALKACAQVGGWHITSIFTRSVPIGQSFTKVLSTKVSRPHGSRQRHTRPGNNLQLSRLTCVQPYCPRTSTLYSSNKAIAFALSGFERSATQLCDRCFTHSATKPYHNNERLIEPPSHTILMNTIMIPLSMVNIMIDD